MLGHGPSVARRGWGPAAGSLLTRLSLQGPSEDKVHRDLQKPQQKQSTTPRLWLYCTQSTPNPSKSPTRCIRSNTEQGDT